MEFRFVYVTAPSVEEARKIALALVEERLAACANILPGMSSVYHWKGNIEQAEECVLILKTRADLFAALEKRVCELHSYETPCVTALPVLEGNKGYLDWIAAETR